MAISAADLRKIFTTDLLDPSLEEFIDVAEILVGPDGCDLSAKGISAGTVDEITRWLAAHLATSDDPRVKSHRSSGHQVTFESEIALGLDSSRYGQMAKRLDKTGCLTQLDKPGRVKFLGRAARASPTSSFKERQI